MEDGDEPMDVGPHQSPPPSHENRFLTDDEGETFFSFKEMSVDGPVDDASSSTRQPDLHSQMDMYRSEEEIGEKMPTAAPDEVTAHVSLAWSGKDIPPRMKNELQKSLQSWLNTGGDLETACSVSVQSLTENSRSALVKIQPSSALDALLKLKPKLLFKDHATCTIQFHKRPAQLHAQRPGRSSINTTEDIPMKVHTTTSSDRSVYRQTEAGFVDGQSGSSETASPSWASNPAVDPSDGGGEDSCLVPLLTFWYVNQAYRKELERIEREHGVKITADVRVSFKGDRPGRDSRPHRALQDFTDLVLKSTDTGEIDSFPIHLDQADSGDCVHTLMKLQNYDAKLVLAATSKESVMYGPKQSIMSVRKVLGLGHNSSTSMASSGAENTPQKIKMDIKDQLEAKGLSIEQSLWKLMNAAFGQKIKDIQGRFGVEFKENHDPLCGKVTVKAQPLGDGQAASLESHAFRALICLYQRVATSVVSCYLRTSDQKAAVGDVLKEIRSQHPLVWPEESYGPWRLIGLPEHLGPAVSELEERLGSPVFKEEDKQRIGYARDQRPGPGAAVGGAAVGGAAGEGGGATGDEEEERCPICLDAFKNKERLKCSHGFCRDCLKEAEKNQGPICPVCKNVFGQVEGNQPPGYMTSHTTQSTVLPGFTCGTIIINYNIPNGQQTERHPSPGKRFLGTNRTAYLPDNKEGREVLNLLQKAFKQKLIFTVGTSRTSGMDDCVTWNDIHHKTQPIGGPACFGYPDPNYLTRVRDELKAKGIE